MVNIFSTHKSVTGYTALLVLTCGAYRIQQKNRKVTLVRQAIMLHQLHVNSR